MTSLFPAAGFASDPDRLQVECDLFGEHIDYVEDVCKLISHVAVREADRVRAKHSQVQTIFGQVQRKYFVHEEIFSGQPSYLRSSSDSGLQHILSGSYL